jgi:hypothetical protein
MTGSILADPVPDREPARRLGHQLARDSPPRQRATNTPARYRPSAKSGPSAPPRHPAGGTVAAPPARHPSSASPGRRAQHRTSPGDTGTLQMDASDHRTITAPRSGHEPIRRHRHSSEVGHGHGQGEGDVQGNGNGNGEGQGKPQRERPRPGERPGPGERQRERPGPGERQRERPGPGERQRERAGPQHLRSPPGPGSGVAATERPHNARRGQMKVGSSVRGDRGMVWQLVGVGHEVLLLSAVTRNHCSGLAAEAGPSGPGRQPPEADRRLPRTTKRPDPDRLPADSNDMGRAGHRHLEPDTFPAFRPRCPARPQARRAPRQGHGRCGPGRSVARAWIRFRPWHAILISRAQHRGAAFAGSALVRAPTAP